MHFDPHTQSYLMLLHIHISQPLALLHSFILSIKSWLSCTILFHNLWLCYRLFFHNPSFHYKIISQTKNKIKFCLKSSCMRVALNILQEVSKNWITATICHPYVMAVRFRLNFNKSSTFTRLTPYYVLWIVKTVISLVMVGYERQQNSLLCNDDESFKIKPD